ncbi:MULTISPECIES: hypothetical protein [unclassified Flavobacterium]|uniref:hypothetical protein n=1 Tax=unclassified Flavobacterium TaxID=196869 RepID=UPI003616AB8A
MKKYLFILLFIVLFSCKDKSVYPKIIEHKERSAVKVNANVMVQFSDYSFLAWNISEDFDIDSKKRYPSNTEQRYLFKRLRPDTLLPRYNIDVIVDTSYVAYASGFEYKYIPMPKNIIIDGLLNGKIPTNMQSEKVNIEFSKYLDEKFKFSDDYVECYPLLVLNRSNDTILSRFKFIQEAKDKNGKWKPIECYYNFGGCGNPEQFHYKLIPEKYMVYPIIKYYGAFKTKLRVKLYNKGNVYYSNEFTGFVNCSQFDTSVLRNEFEKSFPDYVFDEYLDLFFLNKF